MCWAFRNHLSLFFVTAPLPHAVYLTKGSIIHANGFCTLRLAGSIVCSAYSGCLAPEPTRGRSRPFVSSAQQVALPLLDLDNAVGETTATEQHLTEAMLPGFAATHSQISLQMKNFIFPPNTVQIPLITVPLLVMHLSDKSLTHAITHISLKCLKHQKVPLEDQCSELDL